MGEITENKEIRHMLMLTELAKTETTILELLDHIANAKDEIRRRHPVKRKNVKSPHVVQTTHHSVYR